MGKNVDNVRVYGDIESAVYVGQPGTTFPVDPTTPPASGFDELGWLGEDGIKENRDVKAEAKKAWQGGVTVRTVRSADSRKFTFVCLETNAITSGLVRPGSTRTTTSGVTHTPVKAFTGSDIRSWIIDTIDGDIHTRKNVARGEVVDIADVVMNGTDISAFELTVECYPDTSGVLYDEYTDDPALVVEEETP